MKPIYAENIVVAIRVGDGIEWYILDKDYCFLDYDKLEEAYRKKGYDVVIDDTPRFGIKVVNELTQELFLDNIKEYKIEAEKLRKMLMNESNYNEKLAYNPSILIDFNNKVLNSSFIIIAVKILTCQNDMVCDFYIKKSCSIHNFTSYFIILSTWSCATTRMIVCKNHSYCIS